MNAVQATHTFEHSAQFGTFCLQPVTDEVTAKTLICLQIMYVV